MPNLKKFQTWGKLFFAVGFFNCSAAFLLLVCVFAWVWLEFSFSFLFWSICGKLQPFLTLEDVFPHRVNGKNLEIIFSSWLILSLIESCLSWFFGRLSVGQLFQSLGQTFLKNTVAVLILLGFLAQSNARAGFFLLAMFIGFDQLDRYQKTAKYRQLQKV